MNFTVIEKLKEIAINLYNLSNKLQLPESGVIETSLILNDMSWRILNCKNELYISGMEDDNWHIDLEYNQENNTWNETNGNN